MDEKEPFLSRWSRRKLAAKKDVPAGAATADTSPAVAAPPVPTSTQAAAEAQAPATPEYREFFDPKVDEALRRVALKKLFNDPQFNVMDGLDTYIDDYTKADPIPEAMLRQLNQAKDLFLFDDENKADGGAGAAARAAADPAPASPADMSTLEPAAAAGADAAPGTAATPAPDERGNG